MVDDGLSAAQLDDLDAVVTRAAVGIAETGTIVLDHQPDQGRRAISLVPDLHVCIVEATQVVADVPDAIGLLDPARPQTWISGPSATSDIDNVEVGINVAGRSSNPQIAFTSSPSLPQDEVVARILFGSSVTEISALQAVQLAASLNTLRETGGGLNPLGRLRSATGFTRIRILDADSATGRG